MPRGSLSFPCRPRWKGFEVGRVVAVSLFEWDDEADDGGYYMNPISGVICGRTRGSEGQLVIWLDAKTSRGKVRIRLHPDFPGLKTTDEFRAVCAECSKPSGVAMLHEDWSCSLCAPWAESPENPECKPCA